MNSALVNAGFGGCAGAYPPYLFCLYCLYYLFYLFFNGETGVGWISASASTKINWSK